MLLFVLTVVVVVGGGGGLHMLGPQLPTEYEGEEEACVVLLTAAAAAADAVREAMRIDTAEFVGRGRP